MGKSKYSALTQYLKSNNENICKLSFSQLEQIIGSPLPQTSIDHASVFWSNSNQNYSLIWLKAGYITKKYDLSQRYIVFHKNSEAAAKHMLRCSANTTSLTKNNSCEPFILTKQSAVDLNSLVQAATHYFNQTKKEENARYLSWEHCYASFSKYRNNPTEEELDYLSLHLAWYLASWGMLRGGAFLLQKDYKIHIPVVKLLTSERYSYLYSLSIDSLCNQETIRDILQLSNLIVDIYRRKTKNYNLDDGKTASETLITKIILGSIGCVPAYDRYFKQGVAFSNIAYQKYGVKSLLQLANFYKNNQGAFEMFRKQISVGRIEYTPMKIIDMCFWQLGFDESQD